MPFRLWKLPMRSRFVRKLAARPVPNRLVNDMFWVRLGLSNRV